jgi:hypothetical protein
VTRYGAPQRSKASGRRRPRNPGVEGLALFLERFQPEYPDQAINHILLGLGYFDDVDPDDALPVSRQQIVDYWTRRQREIIAARRRQPHKTTVPSG